MANLVTLTEYKQYKKLTKTDDDESLNIIITSVSAMIKTYCGHSFIDYYSSPKTEYFNVGYNQNTVMLTEWPVNSITSVEYRTDVTEAYVATTDYYLDPKIDCLYSTNGDFVEGYGALKVIYTAGYSELPEDVMLSTLDLVTHYAKEEFKERKSIGAASIDNSTRFNSTKFSTSKWPSHVVRTLDMYRNV